jgi:hypothetical protein
MLTGVGKGPYPCQGEDRMESRSEAFTPTRTLPYQ